MKKKIQITNLSSASKILVKTLRFYKNDFTMFAKILAIPVLVYTLGIYIGVGDNLNLGLYYSLLIIGSILIFTSQMATVYFIIHNKEIQNWWECYQKSIRYFWSYLWVGILMSVSFFGGFVLLVIPGIILSTRLALSPFIFFDQKKRGLSALVWSSYYVKGYWWKVFWRLSFFMLIALIISFANTFFLGKFFLIYILGLFLTLFILTPVSFIYLYNIYQELQSIKPQPIPPEEETKSRSALIIYSIIGLTGYLVLIIIMIVGLMFAGFALNKKDKGLESVQNTIADTQITSNIYSLMNATEQYKNNHTAGLEGEDTQMEYIRLGEKLYDIHADSEYYAGDEKILAEIKACVQGNNYIISSDRKVQIPISVSEDKGEYFVEGYFLVVNGTTTYIETEPTCETISNYQ